jgi:hypothetical protein
MFFALACAFPKDAPRFEPLPHREANATLDDLKRDWTDFTISYGGGSVGLASAVIFDPRNDGKSLIGEGYVDVKDKETVEEVISVIESYVSFTPTVYRIYAPSGEFFGFVFTAHYRPFPKKVDDKTLSLPNWRSQSYIGGR